MLFLNKTIDRARICSFVAVMITPALMGCSGTQINSDSIAMEASPLPLVTALNIAQITPIATTLPTAMMPTTLIIWWPEPLAPVDHPELSEEGGVLYEQINTFDLAEGVSVEVDFRRKQPTDTGGIMSTLRTAVAVAPGSVPDVTLLRREDLLTAVQLGLVHPLEDFISPAVIDDLYGVGLELGRVNGEIYGLPYMLDALVLAYHPSETAILSETTWNFEDILAQDSTLLFPAVRPNGISNLFLLQYVSAGGTLPDISGIMTLNLDALEATLSFYEQAQNMGLIAPRTLDAQSSADYLSEIVNGSSYLAVMTSSQYLKLHTADNSLRVASVPTSNGDTVTTVNGWMWVITAETADRQALAARFIDWMMDSDRQRNYAGAIYVLPSQETALLGLNRSLVDTHLMDDLLTHAIPIPPDNLGGIVTRAMQNALIAVLSGEASAEEAVQEVIEQTEGS